MNSEKPNTNIINFTLDSLNNKLFIKQTEAGRYEVALELFKEEDSVAADKFHFILVTKTE